MTNYSDVFGGISDGGMGSLYAGIFVAQIVLAIVLSLTFYIFQSLGQYSLSKRRGIKHAWLAWIPVASAWNFGCISDQYRYLVKGKNTHRRTILLWLNICVFLLVAALLVFHGTLISAFLRFDAGFISDNAFAQIWVEQILMMFGVGIVAFAVGITYLVFYFIASYDLYTSCTPDYSVMLLILSLVFPVTQPFFIFAFRKKDGGMPPRKDARNQI